MAARPRVDDSGDSARADATRGLLTISESARLRKLYADRRKAAGPAKVDVPEPKQARTGPQRGLGRPDSPERAEVQARLGRLLRGVPRASEGREAVGVARSAEPQADRGAAGAATSLVSIRESVPELPAWEPEPEIRIIGPEQICPKKPYVLVADDDPDLRIPVSCDSYACPVCGYRKARQAAGLTTWAIKHADRARFVTLTLAPEDWQKRRKKVRVLASDLRKAGFGWETAWSTERGKETGMIHVHAIQHGDYVPQRHLEAAWGARVDIRKVRTGRGVSQYVTKEALKVAGYVLKGTEAEHGGLEAHLALNGGRAMHWSRKFLHGKDKRGALAAMAAEMGGTDHTFHMEPYDFDTEPALAAQAEEDWPLWD